MPEYLQSGAIIGIQPGELWQMTPAELGYMVEGWKKQQEIHDRRAAQICCSIYEVNRNRKKRAQPYKVEEFMPRRKERKNQTPEQMERIIRELNRAYGGEVIQKAGD